MKNCKRLFCAIAAICLLLLVLPVSANAASEQDIVNSLVLVVLTDEEGSMAISGVLVKGNDGDTYVMTHFIPDGQEIDILPDVLDNITDDDWIPAQIISNDRSIGTALLKPANSVSGNVLRVGAGAPDSGDVTVYGYSAEEDSFQSIKGSITGKTEENGVDILQTDIDDAESSFLGAAVIYKGELLGILGVDGLVAPVNSVGGGGGRGGIKIDTKYYIIGGIVVALIIGAGVFITQKKKKGQVPVQNGQILFQQQEIQAIQFGETPSPGVTVPVSDQNVGLVYQPPQVGSAKGIVGTGGQFRGDSIPIADRIAIGRDPARCHVIFDKMAQGVSSLHCELKNINGVMQLTDRGSSYGTFVGSKKLEVNVPMDLHPGDEFYLGSKQNSFRVE